MFSDIIGEDVDVPAAKPKKEKKIESKPEVPGSSIFLSCKSLSSNFDDISVVCWRTAGPMDDIDELFANVREDNVDRHDAEVDCLADFFSLLHWNLFSCSIAFMWIQMCFFARQNR